MSLGAKLLLSLCVGVVTAMEFVHPGVFVGQTQISFVKSQVAAKVEPQYTAFLKATNSSLGSKSYKAKGPPSNHVIECGSYSKPDYGCSAEDQDASAAFLQVCSGPTSVIRFSTSASRSMIFPAALV